MKFLYYSAASITVAATVALAMVEPAETASVRANHSASVDYINNHLAQKLQAALDKAVQETGVPGASVTFITTDGTWSGSSGFSNLKNQMPMRPQDRFNIASVSKPFTAATVLSLVDEGKLNLEDKLDKWLPASLLTNIPNAGEITIRQLLNHTSGIPDYDENPVIRNNPLNFYLRNWSPQDLVALVKDVPAKNRPGQGYDYSATNYLLAALIVESVTHSTFASQVRSRILEPLSLQDTFIRPQEPVPSDVVSGYYRFSRQQLQAFPPELVEVLNNNFDFVDDNQNRRLYDAKQLLFGSRGYGSGTIISTASDLAKFATALFNGNLLKPETLNEMLTYVNRDVPGFEYGLGVYPLQLPFGKVLGHDGQNPGYVSRMGYLPEYGIAFAVLVNLRDENFTQDNPNAVGDVSAQARDKILLDTALVLLANRQSKSVPEPGAVAGLMGLGVVGLVWRYGKR